ncbi:hypothetical protein FK220_011290 [Flavobacteriaceae bacterium TP-CH-4]|uniref:Uncharacterized protein n=1 Tax=Pelagihabitans pacificus TaxID=2696054 RepID=A0A967EE18_9FLAO|nr:hypothetical protein [Pelagihabitans pacificus]NHF59928.1 hypothetical protein [Pelagihabitans pacificus]
MASYGKPITLIAFLIIILVSHGQDDGGGDIEREAYHFKLDYNVPESPAFSVLDANPTTVMRGNAAQEVVVNLASNFIGSQGVNPGLAVDFNPYFVFGGRLKSLNEYRDNPGKRMLANTQVSLATVSSQDFPDDLLFSGGVRVTLFDSKDLQYDLLLSKDIDDALSESIPVPMPGQSQDRIIKNPSLKKAYERAKARYRHAKGGSLSFGYAMAGRAVNRSFQLDSILTYRHQAWFAGQYDFGKSQMSLNGMLMYRYEKNPIDDSNGVIGGLAVRHFGKKIILTGELVYDELANEIGFGAYIEAYLMPNISIYASVGRDSTRLDGSNDYAFKPGIKWNLSEAKTE